MLDSDAIEVVVLWLRQNFDLGGLNSLIACMNAMATMLLMVVATRAAGMSCCCNVVALLRRLSFLALSFAFLLDALVSIETDGVPLVSHVAINAAAFPVLTLGVLQRVIEQRRAARD